MATAPLVAVPPAPEAIPTFVERIVETVADRLLPGLSEDADVLHVVTPADWARQGMSAGTPFALAHTFAQTGPFRPANTVRGVDNAVLAGSSTVPGVGVPTALLSGRLAADRVTGTDNPNWQPPVCSTCGCAPPTGIAVRSTPSTVARSFWLPDCSPRGSGQPYMPCMDSHDAPTTFSTTSITASIP